MLQSALARMIGFVPQGVAILVATHLIVKHYGVDAFSSYALIVSVLMLIPLNNLGAGASVTQVVSAHGVDDDLSLRTATTSARVLTISGLALTVFSVAVALADLWPTLLGKSSGANGFVAAGIILYAISFVPGLGQNVLLATGRNHHAIALQVLNTVLGAAFVAVMVLTDLDQRWLVVVPSAAILIVNLIAMAMSQRMTHFPWATVLRRVPLRKEFPGARIRSLALPMMVISLSLPIAFLADRIVLSQVSTETQVSRYALVLQIFAPISGLVMATSQPLWPMFTRARAEGRRGPRLALVLGVFLGATLVANIVLIFIADPLGRLISGDKIALGYGLPMLAAGFTVVQAVAFPLTMSMVDPAGARLVAWGSAIAVPANLTLSVILAREWGASGPFVSALAVCIVVQMIPWLIFTVRRSRSGEAIAVM